MCWSEPGSRNPNKVLMSDSFIITYKSLPKENMENELQATKSFSAGIRTSDLKFKGPSKEDVRHLDRGTVRQPGVSIQTEENEPEEASFVLRSEPGQGGGWLNAWKIRPSPRATQVRRMMSGKYAWALRGS